MSEQPVEVHRVCWQELCPWTIIFRTLPVAASVSVLVLALLGVLLTPMGWRLSEVLFVRQEHRETDSEFMHVVSINNSPYRSVFPAPGDDPHAISIMGVQLSGPRLVFTHLTRSFRAWFDGRWQGWKFCYFLFGGLWTLVVWSFLGLGITRICLLRLTRNEHAGLDDAFDFMFEPAAGDESRWSNWVSALGAIGIPLAAVGALCLPTFLIGLLLGIDVGVLIAGVIWIIVLLIALMMALILLGLLFGWPLMVSSVAAESQNAFDAMTRGYAYTFQRPLNYLVYILIAVLFGGFCWLIAGSVADGVLELAYWATSWGANVYGSERMDVVQGYNPVSEDEVSWSLEAGRNLIGLWNGLIKSFAAAFIYGLFWCMASAVYLLLRFDVDETEMDELFLVDERRSYQLPPLKSDENGIPQVQKPDDQTHPGPAKDTVSDADD